MMGAAQQACRCLGAVVGTDGGGGLFFEALSERETPGWLVAAAWCARGRVVSCPFGGRVRPGFARLALAVHGHGVAPRPAPGFTLRYSVFLFLPRGVGLWESKSNQRGGDCFFFFPTLHFKRE
jgi:hypothetical protein